MTPDIASTDDNGNVGLPWEYIKDVRTKYTFDSNIPGPTTIHEHMFRSYFILEEVKEMLKRNDSQETILKVISYLSR